MIFEQPFRKNERTMLPLFCHGTLYGRAEGGAMKPSPGFLAVVAFILFSAPIWSYASGPPAMPQFTLWTDPAEHAFTVKVPVGWRISGGTHRNAPIDARNYVRADSPDGKIRIWIDDPNILPRQAPHPAYYRMGWYEGRVVQSPAGPLLIERFQTGARYAQEYVTSNVCRT